VILVITTSEFCEYKIVELLTLLLTLLLLLGILSKVFSSIFVKSWLLGLLILLILEVIFDKFDKFDIWGMLIILVWLLFDKLAVFLNKLILEVLVPSKLLIIIT